MRNRPEGSGRVMSEWGGTRAAPTAHISHWSA